MLHNTVVLCCYAVEMPATTEEAHLNLILDQDGRRKSHLKSGFIIRAQMAGASVAKKKSHIVS